MEYLWYPRNITLCGIDAPLWSFRLIDGKLYVVSQNIIEDNASLFITDSDEKCLLASFNPETTLFEYDDEAIDILRKNFNTITNRNILSEYLRNTIAYNRTVYDAIFMNPSFSSTAENVIRQARDYNYPGATIVINIIQSGLLVLEKIITSCGYDFFKTNICKDELCLANEKKKLKQVLGLPPAVIEFLKCPTFASLYKPFKEVADTRDINDTSLLIDYITTAESLDKEIRIFDKSIKPYVEAILSIALLTPTTKMQTIINYLHSQAANFRDGIGLACPFTEAIEWRDYLLIAKANNIVVDPLPSNIKSAHFYLVSNTKYSSDEEKTKEFEAAVNKYSHLSYEDKDFAVVVPKSIKDMITEGQTQHHCIANYVDLVCNGTATVLFLRKKDDVDTPYISFEITEDGEFVQIKGKYDCDIEPDGAEFSKALEFLTNWREIKFGEKEDALNAEEVSES
jgi:hypothetical protein